MSEFHSSELDVARLSALSPKGYALGLHIRTASAHVMIQTYDARWIKIYNENQYMRADPMVYWGFGHTGCIRWSEIDFPDPLKIFEQAASFGLKYGICIAHGPMSSRSIGGFARSDREFSDEETHAIEEIFLQAHEKTMPPHELTAAQRVALQLIANGKRNAEASAILGISESGLKARLRSARERLSVRTTTEAIQRAQENKLL